MRQLNYDDMMARGARKLMPCLAAIDAGVWQPTRWNRLSLYFGAQHLNEQITKAVLAGFPIQLDARPLQPVNARIKVYNYDRHFESGSCQVGLAASHLEDVSAENLSALVTIAAAMTRFAQAVA